jgi:hypothetical protein
MKTRRAKSRTKTRRVKRGGQVIGTGKYAMVIDPPIQCADGKHDMTKYVSRVSKREQKEDIVSKDHPRLIKKLKEIDPEQKYLFYPEYCQPGILSEENKRDGVTYKNKAFSEIVLKGSEVWNPSMRKKRSWAAFLKGKHIGKKVAMAEKSVEQLEHLKKAIDLLHDNHIMHGDLHGKNVIIADDGMPRIIDFGTSLLDAPNRVLEWEKGVVEDSWPTLDWEWRKSR